MDIYMTVYVDKIDNEELVEASYKAIKDFYTRKDYYMKGLPNSDVLNQIADYLSDNVEKFFDVEDLCLEFEADLDDTDKLEDMAWNYLVDWFYNSLWSVIPLTISNPDGNLNMEEEIENINDGGEHVLVYKSDKFACFYPAQKLKMKPEKKKY